MSFFNKLGFSTEQGRANRLDPETLRKRAQNKEEQERVASLNLGSYPDPETPTEENDGIVRPVPTHVLANSSQPPTLKPFPTIKEGVRGKKKRVPDGAGPAVPKGYVPGNFRATNTGMPSSGLEGAVDNFEGSAARADLDRQRPKPSQRAPSYPGQQVYTEPGQPARQFDPRESAKAGANSHYTAYEPPAKPLHKSVPDLRKNNPSPVPQLRQQSSTFPTNPPRLGGGTSNEKPQRPGLNTQVPSASSNRTPASALSPNTLRGISQLPPGMDPTFQEASMKHGHFTRKGEQRPPSSLSHSSPTSPVGMAPTASSPRNSPGPGDSSPRNSPGPDSRRNSPSPPPPEPGPQNKSILGRRPTPAKRGRTVPDLTKVPPMPPMPPMPAMPPPPAPRSPSPSHHEQQQQPQGAKPGGLLRSKVSYGHSSEPLKRAPPNQPRPAPVRKDAITARKPVGGGGGGGVAGRPKSPVARARSTSLGGKKK